MRRLVVVMVLVGCAAVGTVARERAVAQPVAAEVAPSGAVEDEAPVVQDDEPIVVASAPARVEETPAPKSCREALTLAHVQWAEAAPSKTVHDPVKIAPGLRGVTFRHEDDPVARWLWVDCKFAQRLDAAASIFAARGVREVIHVGTYEPKCLNGGTPDDNPACKPSAHAQGMAIDVVALVRQLDGAREVVSFEKDFIKRRDRSPTCTMPRDSEKDAFLKDLVCALDGTFTALLTPNWDERHRTHAHLALHPTAKAYWANGVDPLVAPE